MVDSGKKLRRQLERRKRREIHRQLYEDQLLNIAYGGYTEKQRQIDEQLKTQIEWLNSTTNKKQK